MALGLAASAASQRVFFEDFETSGSDWITDNGIWEFGTPSVGPGASHSGFQCSGTVLNGNYFGYDDSRLIYPRPSGTAIQLPTVSGDEEIRLRYWAWYSYSSYDVGYSQVQYWDTTNSAWSAWESVPGAKSLTEAHGWHLKDVDLTSYAGKEIKLGFYHTASRNSWGDASESTGWYLDDVEVVKVLPLFSGDFESGADFWTVEDGLWEFGEPSTGPGSGYLSTNCVGTRLHGNYFGYKDSRLVSPTVSLPTVTGSQTLWLGFRQWWSYSSYDSGNVQISTQDPVTLGWSGWTVLPGSGITGTGVVWSLEELELTAYAGMKARIAFFHSAGRNSWGDASESTGWYVDDVFITGVATPPRDPELSIQVNGLDQDINLSTTDIATVTVELDSGDYEGVSSELWIGASTTYGLFWYDKTLDEWSRWRSPFSQGPLADVAKTTVYASDLPQGTYTLLFILDSNPDGKVDVTQYNTADVYVQ